MKKLTITALTVFGVLAGSSIYAQSRGDRGGSEGPNAQERQKAQREANEARWHEAMQKAGNNRADIEKVYNDIARKERDNATQARDRGDVSAAASAARVAKEAAKNTSNADAQKDARDAAQAAREARAAKGGREN